MARTPYGYDGPKTTSHHAGKLAAGILDKIKKLNQDQPEVVLNAWPEIIGPQLASMAEAVEFRDGVLGVKVKNSTLYSLLKNRDKLKLLKILRNKFPHVRDIAFRIG